jgi:hypothetical protein
MIHKKLRFMMIALGLAAALTASIAVLQAVSAQGTGPTGITAPSFPEPPGHLEGVRFIHVATAGNSAAHVTYLDHYLTNDNPDAIVFVSKSLGTYNDHSIGVYYDHGEDRWAIFNQDLAAMPFDAVFNILIPDSGTNVFVHEATAGNISGNYTLITHPLLDSNPDALVFVTQNWNPSGVGGTYNDQNIGVWYSNTADKWAIFNQDTISSMPVGASFNVLVLDADASTFVHAVKKAACTLCYINHPLANGNPRALIYITQNWNPGGGGGTYNDHPVGVAYDYSERKWFIINQDLTSAPAGAAFNVAIPVEDESFFVHEASASNSTYNYTFIDRPRTNDDPNAIAFVTQNWNPGGGLGVYNDHEIGVWYDDLSGRWSIFNQYYTSTLPISASFNVLIPNVNAGVFVHRTTTATIDANVTYIDHPLTNNVRSAILFVTQNWNPGGLGGVYNDHAIGVYWSVSEEKWAVFNQDLASMPISATFNILAFTAEAETVFVHETTSQTVYASWTYLDHPLANGNPYAVLLVTSNWNPWGAVPAYHNHEVGVFYDSTAERWAIFNQDLASMPEGVAFNVLVRVRRVYLPLVLR